MVTALVQCRNTRLGHEIWRIGIVARCKMLDGADYVNSLLCRERYGLNGIAGGIGVNKMAAVVVGNARLERVLALEARNVDALALRLRRRDSRVLLLFLHGGSRRGIVNRMVLVGGKGGGQ